MQRYSAYSDIQVRGSIMQTFTMGLGSSWRLINRIMLAENLGTMGPNGLIEIDPMGWFSLKGYLLVIERVRKDFGDVAVRQLAATVPRFVPDLAVPANIRAAFLGVDLAYHQTHGRGGRPLFCEKTGQMIEGIGHYLVSAPPEQNQITCETTGPYPCAFDQGLLLSIAQMHEPTAVLTHALPETCRALGAASCTYALTWP